MSSDPRKPPSASIERVLNGAAIALIALSLLAQLLQFALNISGRATSATPLVLGVVEYLSMAIVPGLGIAFVKFLLNVVRSFRSAAARAKALMYFLITLSPLLFVTWGTIDIARSVPVSAVKQPESAQYLAGFAWADAQVPTRDSECLGSEEYQRGCRKAIHNRREAQLLAGREWASLNSPAKASDCKGQPYFALGCRRYFFEHLAKTNPPGQEKYEGMTTAECKEEINANYQLSKELNLENGNTRAVEVELRKHWLPELRDCENYDRVAEGKIMSPAYDRLGRAVDKLKAGQSISEEEQAELLKDKMEMSKVRDQPYKTAYDSLYEEYTARSRRTYIEPQVSYPSLTCIEYQAKLDELGQLDKKHVAAMQVLKRGDGWVIDSAEWSRLNEERIRLLPEMKLYLDGAKAAGCK